MKKLNARQLRWLEKRSHNQRRRTARKIVQHRRVKGRRRQYHGPPVRVWQGGAPQIAICTSHPLNPPEILCFETNPEETTQLFHLVRGLVVAIDERGEKFLTQKKGSRTPRIKGYVDFAKIKYISPAAATVLTAEYDRLAKLSAEVPPTINLHLWDRAVVTTLYQQGFFEALGHLPDLGEQRVLDGPRLTMKVIASEDASRLDEVDASLQELALHVAGTNILKAELGDAVIALLTSISEAITNVTQHAYPNGHDYAFKHVNRLWVSATADRDNRTLTVVVYDQGATIPVTYPRLSLKDKALRFFRSALVKGKEFDISSDGTYIRAAMRYGGSRTDKPYRGKGFPQMGSLLKAVGGGSMSIRSRNGWCTSCIDGRLKSGFVSHSVGGTLIELTANLGPLLDGIDDDD